MEPMKATSVNSRADSETCEFYGKNGHVDTSMADGLLAGGAKAVMGYVNNVYSVYSRSMLLSLIHIFSSSGPLQTSCSSR